MSKPYIANHYLRASIAGAVRQGHAADTLLARADIPSHWLDRSQQSITEQQLTRVIKSVWRATGDEFMGLASQRCNNGVFALMAELAQQAKTLGGMLRQSARFYTAVCDCIDIGLEEAGDESRQVFFRLHLQDAGNDSHHMLQEFLLLMWQRFGSWLVGQKIPFACTQFSYPAPAHAKEYEAMFSGALAYDRPCCGFYLQPRYLQLPIIRTETELVEFLRESPAHILHRPDQDDSLQTQIRLILQQHDFDQMPDLDAVSHQLHITPRTLRRRLREEGASLRQIKEVLRRDFAIKLLAGEHLSIAEVSSKTGFSETAAFCRAFKRWTGKAPSNWKQAD